MCVCVSVCECKIIENANHYQLSSYRSLKLSVKISTNKSFYLIIVTQLVILELCMQFISGVYVILGKMKDVIDFKILFLASRIFW